ncbi:hypothetical protein ACFLRT_03380 [Acidobacteriota bacterium]
MMEGFVSELTNFITANKYVNLYSKGFTRKKEDQQNVGHFRSQFEKEYGNSLIDIDITKFEACETEEDEAEVILELINKALGINGSKGPIPDAISIAEALKKLSQKLDERNLVVFHCVSDIHDEKEKDILRAIRKFIEIFDKSQYLGILIISDRPTHHWELYPESNLDDRHVAIIEYPPGAENK